VVDDAGTLIGAVASVEIDPANGQITSITAHKGGMLGLGGASTTIEASSVHGIGPELLTIAALPEPPPESH
jgi:sporulation protein YlmC with PRC-barrel domain